MAAVVIKYLGSKRLLLPAILDAVRADASARSVLDLFSGTSRVGHALKAAGLQVVANDHNAYAATLARCYVQADDEWMGTVRRLLQDLSTVPPRAGWFTDMYCVQSRYFHPKNGARIEAIRESIAERDLEPELEAIVLTSLMEAADRVDSTTGVQMAYLKQWARRAHNDLELRPPALLPRAEAGKGRAFQEDALTLASRIETDVAYLDPPYNQHKYLGNYHLWETLVRWDQPETYGIARKRVDCRERKSPFNSRPRITDAIATLIGTIRARTVVVSFSDEGFIDRETMEELLRSRGEVRVFEHAYRRYVGAQIGIHNPRGQKVGRVSHLRNRERLFVTSSNPAVLKALATG